MEALEKALSIMENIQYFHQCSDGSQWRREENVQHKRTMNGQQDNIIGGPEVRAESNEDHEREVSPDVDDKDIQAARKARIPARELKHGQTALAITFDHGFFPLSDGDCGAWKSVSEKATFKQMEQYLCWEAIINDISKTNLSSSPVDDRLTIPTSFSQPRSVPDEIEPGIIEWIHNDGMSLGHLNEEQNRAYKIVASHVHASLEGKSPPQLLMTVIGSGGIGKSTLINAITALFERNEIKDLLAITATSGVAASLIGGTTLHWWGGIPWRKVAGDWTSEGSTELKQRRKANMLNNTWLITDKISMATTTTVAQASQVASKVRGEHVDSTVPFGGLNVLFFGDFHQFPPPAKKAGCLYANDAQDTMGTLGKSIYLQFDTVVILSQQMCIRDETWVRILSRLREGACMTDDLSEI
jgi:hypothetical protein